MLAFDYRLTKITYPGNGDACYQYDPDGHLTRVGRSPTAPRLHSAVAQRKKLITAMMAKGVYLASPIPMA